MATSRLRAPCCCVGLLVASSTSGLLVGCSDDKDKDVMISVGALIDAESVFVADLTAFGEEVSGQKRLQIADFRSASEEDATAIASLMGDEGSYADSENACFNHDVGVQFMLPGGRVVRATVGLTCWNVRFFPTGGVEVVPNVRYLQPTQLEALAGLFHSVIPTLDISHVGE